MTTPSLVTSAAAACDDVGSGNHAFTGTITVGSVPNGLLRVVLNLNAGASLVRLGSDGTGPALTPLASEVFNSTTRNVEVWYMVNPPTGTYGIFVESSYTIGAAIIELWQDVHQTTPFGTPVGDTFTSVAETLTAASPSNGVVVDAVGCQWNDPTPTPNAGQTPIQTGVTGNAWKISSSFKAASGSVVMSWASAMDSAAMAVALNPAASGGGGGGTTQRRAMGRGFGRALNRGITGE